MEGLRISAFLSSRLLSVLHLSYDRLDSYKDNIKYFFRPRPSQCLLSTTSMLKTVSIWLGGLLALLLIASVWGYFTMIRMPGESFQGQLSDLSREELVLRGEMRLSVEDLAGEIGERNVQTYGALAAAENYLAASLQSLGFQVHRRSYEVAGRTCDNLEVEIKGKDRADEIVIVGAHYDSAPGTAGANDNATGVAATLALARSFVGAVPSRTLRFLFFVNEEPPFFQGASMGSRVYAAECRSRGENVVAMISLETIGCFSDAEGSQEYPFPMALFYPSTGNFIAFVGNLDSRELVHESIATFRDSVSFPSEGAAAIASIPGIGWSDHWSFWQEGYQAIMITDTAPFRYEHYHTSEDTPEKIDYDRMARVVSGVRCVVDHLANKVSGP